LDNGGAIVENAPQQLIERRSGRWYIPNPVNPGENFADRWNDSGSHRAEAFFQWVRWVKEDIARAVEAQDTSDLKLILMPLFGKRVTKAAMDSGRGATNAPATHTKVRVSNPSKPWGTDGC
jgi:hypothetical protein